MDETLKVFLIETQEFLAQLDQDLVLLEKSPRDAKTLAQVFRLVHSIKGAAGFYGFSRMEAVTHAAESLLARLRDGQLLLTPAITTALLGTVDALRHILAGIEAHEREVESDHTALIATLQRLQKPEEAPSEPARPTEPEPAAEGSAAEGAEGRGPGVADSTLRVDVGLLDKLMNLVGELVLARNQIVQYTASQEDTAFLATSQRLNLITTELQAGVMKTRLQPIGNIWNKFPRLVRDLAADCGKLVRIDMEGSETELDKTIIEAIRDPLTHLVRNAVDHGIEFPHVRRQLNKPEQGRLVLHAFHEGGKVNIEISDDGHGIDAQKIRERAVAAKLVSAEQTARMSDRELTNLIFLPGLSTAERVTRVSGRGVGMDVVKTNIERIGGTVDIDSRPGRGTTLKMKIPLTLAIIPALTVTSGGDRYAIPQVSLLELVRLEGELAHHGIESIHGALVYRLRGNLLPLVYLNRELGVERDNPSGDAAVNIVVLQADDRQFGLVVDSIHDTEEIVVKPLQKQLKGITVFAGATIMGDGKVALILDVLGIAQRAHVVSGLRERGIAEKAAPTAEKQADLQSILLFATADGRMAIPLSQVARLEEFPRSAVERVGGQEVAQYRGEILPLIDVARVLVGRRKRRANGTGSGTGHANGSKRGRGAARTDGETVQVVVYAGDGRRVGLVIGSILDIVEESLAVRSRASRKGVQFTAVIQGRVTEFLDVEAIIRRSELDAADRAPNGTGVPVGSGVPVPTLRT